MGLEAWKYDNTIVFDQSNTKLAYTESRDSGTESYSPDNSNANRVFFVKWLQRAQFLDDLLGYAYINPSNGINRILPAEHPDLDTFFASEASVQPMHLIGAESDRDAAKFEIAKITCTYKNLDYDVLPDSETGGNEINRFVSLVSNPSGEFVSLQGCMRWVTRSTHQLLAFPPNKLIAKCETTYTWHKVPAKLSNQFIPPSFNNIISLLGKLNNATFDGNPVGTMLFLGAEPKMVKPALASDRWYWDIAYKFLVMNNGNLGGGIFAGPNCIYDTINQRWDLVSTDGTLTGGRIYQPGDFTLLFKIDT